VCGIDIERARESSGEFDESNIDYDALCSPACVALTNGADCKAMKLDSNINNKVERCRLTL